MKIMMIALSLFICFTSSIAANETNSIIEDPTQVTPVTKKDYLELASAYKDYADYYRQEANMHRKMKKDARMWSDKRSGAEQFIREHCDAIIADLESLASKMDKFSEWYEASANVKSGG